MFLQFFTFIFLLFHAQIMQAIPFDAIQRKYDQAMQNHRNTLRKVDTLSEELKINSEMSKEISNKLEATDTATKQNKILSKELTTDTQDQLNQLQYYRTFASGMFVGAVITTTVFLLTEK